MHKLHENIKAHRNKIIIPVFMTAVLIFSGSSYYLGLQKGLAETKNIEITGLKNAENPDSVREDFNVFWEAWSTLKAKHINSAKTTDRQFVEGAIEGIAGALDDPYTTYFNPDDSKRFNDDVKGAFGGIGAEIGIRDDQLIVIAPLKD